MIPDNDPVRLLNACVEGMDLSELYQTYTRVPKNLATPKQLFKIVAYAAMNGIYSSRKIEAACRQNINYMYLLEGKPAPDNATIARFISLHLAQCSKELMAESTWLLRRNGLISSEVVFIDGTKIEANANKYTFVWKKAVSKNQARMLSKVAELIAVCEEVYGIRVAYNDWDQNAQTGHLYPHCKYHRRIGRLFTAGSSEQADRFPCRWVFCSSGALIP